MKLTLTSCIYLKGLIEVKKKNLQEKFAKFNFQLRAYGFKI